VSPESERSVTPALISTEQELCCTRSGLRQRQTRIKAQAASTTEAAAIPAIIASWRWELLELASAEAARPETQV